jgi:hypothetical protein
MEPLKEMFGPVFYNKLAGSFKQVYKPFPTEQFLKDVLEPLAVLSLNERIRHTSVTPQQHLPPDYGKAIAIMREVIPLNQYIIDSISPDVKQA